ncbi:MAG: hypothetical protein JST00_34910 [Deltaproteobacteria bacterium]|nr:hypothetical protein [Deltaproteobacteria bacterium]
MDPRYYGVIEISFTASIVLGLGLWQLWSLRREQRRDREKAALSSTSTSTSTDTRERDDEDVDAR